jgi:AcrR family transcriptional regulator
MYRTQYVNYSGTMYGMSRGVVGRPARYNREQVARVAFEIADREGFDAVSMRRVAQELGAGTMTLYNYVRTKDELVALMDDQFMAGLLLGAEESARPWPDAFLAILRRTYRLRIAHPWSLTALQNAPQGANALRHAEQTLAALDGSPFTDAQKLVVMAVADSFVDGHALHRAEVLAEPVDHPEAAAHTRRTLDLLESGPYRRMRDSMDQLSGSRAAEWMDEAFERGLAALLDGLIRAYAG